MMKTETTENRCAICGAEPLDHLARQHVYTTIPGDLREKPSPEKDKVNAAPHPALGTDIVLRLALVNAGVITADDIAAAETQLGMRVRPGSTNSPVVGGNDGD